MDGGQDCISLKSFDLNDRFHYTWLNQSNISANFPLYIEHRTYHGQVAAVQFAHYYACDFIFRLSFRFSLNIMLFCIRQTVTVLLAVLFTYSMLFFSIFFSDYLGNWCKAIFVFFDARAFEMITFNDLFVL